MCKAWHQYNECPRQLALLNLPEVQKISHSHSCTADLVVGGGGGPLVSTFLNLNNHFGCSRVPLTYVLVGKEEN